MKIKKNYLLLLAGIVWLAAGFNILRIGIISYKSYVTLINLALSAAVFFLFWFMVFGKLVRRHTDRIVRYEEEMQFILQFFDRKSFCIMAFMMTFAIGLRTSGLISLSQSFTQGWEPRLFWRASPLPATISHRRSGIVSR